MTTSTAPAEHSASTSTHFSLAGRSLKLDTADDIAPHLTPLHSHPDSYTSLDFSGNTFGTPACEKLASLLPTSRKSITSVNFADIFTSRLLNEIPPSLQSLLNTGLLALPHLHTVDLSDNAFGLNTVAPLEQFLALHTPLRHLVLQNNGLGPTAGAKVANALVALAARKRELHTGEGKVQYLETVICGRNRLESGSMSAWADAITAHKDSLRTVKMVQNGIRQDGVITLLSKGLGSCQGESLECVDLQDNTFTITGARALAEVVGRWQGLKELGVGDSLLGARGAVLLGEALQKGGANKKLEVLRLQYNEIDAKGIKSLLEAAKGLDMLRRVELNGNKFAEDDEGVEGLRLLLLERKEKLGGGEQAVGEWGLDELSDLEEESDEEVEEESADEEGEDKEAERERMVQDTQNAEEQPVTEKKDKEVDALADELDKAHVS